MGEFASQRCPTCGRGAKPVFGRCPECGAKWGDALLAVTEPRTPSGSLWEDLGYVIGVVPSLAFIGILYLVFGVVGAAAGALVAIVGLAAWIWLNYGGQ
jgi:hypothetical protein